MVLQYLFLCQKGVLDKFLEVPRLGEYILEQGQAVFVFIGRIGQGGLVIVELGIELQELHFSESLNDLHLLILSLLEQQVDFDDGSL